MCLEERNYRCEESSWFLGIKASPDPAGKGVETLINSV